MRVWNVEEGWYGLYLFTPHCRAPEGQLGPHLCPLVLGNR